MKPVSARDGGHKWRLVAAFVAIATLVPLRSPTNSYAAARPLAVAVPPPIGPLTNLAELAKPASSAEPAAAAPFALSSPDGEGLRLQAVDARVAVDGPLVWTELWLTFRNPENRVREGRFSITLPPDASLGRFAMQIGDRWMDGEVVEKHAAEVAYEDFLHARQDPAILSKDAGNIFSARVFPIGANADKRLVVAWSQTRGSAEQPLVVPLRGLPSVPALSVRAWQASADRPPRELVAADLHDVQPHRDLRVHVPPQQAGDVDARRAGEVAVGRVTVGQEDAAAPFGRLIVLVDTSASAALVLEARLQVLAKLVGLAAANGAKALRVIAFDQVQTEVYAGSPAGFGQAQLAALHKRAALGASDLAAALRLVAGQAGGPARLVLLSDCVATLGETDANRLPALAKNLGAAQIQRLDVVLPAGGRDDALARSLVSAGLAQPGVVIGGSDVPLQRLARTVLPRVAVYVPGAVWVWPDTVDALQAGDSFVVTASLPADAPFEVRLSGGAAGNAALPSQVGNPALLARAAATAQVARLEAAHRAASGADKAARAKQLIDVSVQNRVLSDLTAFLVLETEADYARYKIDRSKPAQLLAIAETGVVGFARRGDPAAALAQAKGGPAEADRREPDQPSSGPAQARNQPAASRHVAQNRLAEQAIREAARRRPEVSHNIEELERRNDRRHSGGSGGARPAARAGFERRRAEQTGGASANDRNAKKEETSVQIKMSSGTSGSGEAKADIAKVVSRKNSAVQRCYEQALRDNPDVGGKVKVTFTVGTEGTVAEVSVSGASGAFAECIKSKFMSIRGLPQLPSPQTFGQTYVFSKDGSIDSRAVESAEQRRERLADEAREHREALQGSRAGQAAQARVDARYVAALRLVRGHDAAARACLRQFQLNPADEVAVVYHFDVTAGVSSATADAANAAPSVEKCIATLVSKLRSWPKSDETINVQVAYRLSADRFEAYPAPAAVAAHLARERRAEYQNDGESSESCRLGPLAVDPSAALAESVEPNFESAPDPAAARYWQLQRRGASPATAAEAWQWHVQAPGEILPLVLYGQLVAKSDPQQAARAFGSLIDLHPARADLRRYAGNLLESLGTAGHAVAVDSYNKAVRLRPDHVSGYPQLVWALVRAGRHAEAFTELRNNLSAERRREAARMSNHVAIDSMGLVAAIWLAAEPTAAAQINAALQSAGAALPKGPVLRFLLTWETDANDVDFHVRDGKGAQACYSAPELRSGGHLFEDVTTGYGPEWFAIDRPRAFPYQLFAHYYARGPMGFGMGRVLVVQWDGKRATFADHPFVVTADDQAVAIGRVVR